MLNQLHNELQQNNRLRVGLWLIIIIIVSYGLLFLHDYRVALQAQAQQLRQRIQQIKAIRNTTYWTERAEQAQAYRLHLESRLWQANSKGLAQANFQAWLNEEVLGTQLKHVQLQVDGVVEIESLPNLWKVTAEVNSDFDADGLMALLYSCAHHTQWVIADMVEVETLSNRIHLKVLINAYFQATE